MNKLLAIIAVTLAVAIAAPALAADYPPCRQRDRERATDCFDRQGNRIEARMERRGEHFGRHFKHRKEQPKAYRHHDRRGHAYGPPPYAPWCGERLALRLDGLGIFWSHRH